MTLDPKALVDDVDRGMVARGDRIGADLQRSLLRFYDEHTALPAKTVVEVKPLDLANLLRHAFMFGLQTMGGTAETAKDWWPVYDPEDCPAFERIRAALAGIKGLEAFQKEVMGWLRERELVDLRDDEWDGFTAVIEEHEAEIEAAAIRGERRRAALSAGTATPGGEKP